MNRPKIKVKPGKPGLIVRDPVNMSRLDEKGEYKPKDSYWMRRLMVGDVILMSDDPKPKAEEAPKAEEKYKKSYKNKKIQDEKRGK